jgi:hypothetical protein
MNIEHSIDAAEAIFARLLLILEQRWLASVDSSSWPQVDSIALLSSTLVHAKVPASSGFQSRKRTSQRGVMAPNCGAVLVTFAS